MYIINNPVLLEKERAKKGRIQLWKVIAKNNTQGVWSFTSYGRKFRSGRNVARPYDDTLTGEFHCYFTRKAARRYILDIAGWLYKREQLKIIKVYADRQDIVTVGVNDGCLRMPAISVSKMEIKSLKHQR